MPAASWTARRCPQAARSCGGQAAASRASDQADSTSRPASKSLCAPRPARASSPAAVSQSQAVSMRMSPAAGSSGPAIGICRLLAQFMVVSKRGTKEAAPCAAQALRASCISCA